MTSECEATHLRKNALRQMKGLYVTAPSPMSSFTKYFSVSVIVYCWPTMNHDILLMHEGSDIA